MYVCSFSSHSRHYYSLVIDWRKNDLEEQMLMNLHRKDWSSGLYLQKFEEHQKSSEVLLQDMVRLSAAYSERVKDEEGRTEVIQHTHAQYLSFCINLISIQIYNFCE